MGKRPFRSQPPATAKRPQVGPTGCHFQRSRADIAAVTLKRDRAIAAKMPVDRHNRQYLVRKQDGQAKVGENLLGGTAEDEVADAGMAKTTHRQHLSARI